jgi:pyruvate dehydrogenase E1 component
MPDFWEFPTVSMGLGPMAAIYQARFNRYLHNRGLADTSNSRVWAFLGDGEMDEPEALGALRLAAREKLDNLVFVVNCNLQRLDGPVRGNGKIIQELEADLPRRRLERHQGRLGPRMGRPAGRRRGRGRSSTR